MNPCLRLAVLFFMLCIQSSLSAQDHTAVSDSQGRAAVLDLRADPVQVKPLAEPGIAAIDWQALGPFGGDVSDVAASPIDAGLVMAGLAPSSGSGTLYRSLDAGATWTETAALSGISVYDIEFAPSGIVYLGTLDSVWKSLDGGDTWTSLELNLGINDQVVEVTIDPADEGRIWAGVASAMGNQPMNVMRSIDGGANWTDVTPPLASPMTCAGIAVDSLDSNRLAACFQGSFNGGQVWISTTGGASWVNRSAGLPNNPMNDAAFVAGRLLICGGQLFGSQHVGVYATGDDGLHWTALHNASWPSLAISDIEIDPHDPNRLFAASVDKGVFFSSDGGVDWTFGAGGTSSLALNEVSFSPGSSQVIYLGATSNAVWKSDNGGAAFAPSSAGMGQLNVYSMAANPNNPLELAIAFQGLNNGGVYTTLNGGYTWTLESLPGTRFNTVGFAPDGTLYAISDGPTTIGAEGLWRRSGSEWAAIGPNQGPNFEAELFALAFSLDDPGLILTGGSDFGSVQGFDATVWITPDKGATWTKVYQGDENEDVMDIEILRDGTDSVFLASFTDYGTAQTGGVIRSSDGGETWLPSSAGLPAKCQCISLSPAPESALAFYLCDDYYGGGGVFKTEDGGQSWASTGYVGRVMRVAAHPSLPGRLYIARYDSQIVYESMDGGATFVPLGGGLASAGSPRDLAFAPAQSDLLLAANTGAYAIEMESPLSADPLSLSAATGGQVLLRLDAGQAQALRTFLVLGSLTGVYPEIPLPGHAAALPLAWDAFTDYVLYNLNTALFSNFLGSLDSLGRAEANIQAPPLRPTMASKVMRFAYLLEGAPWDYASNAAAVIILP